METKRKVKTAIYLPSEEKEKVKELAAHENISASYYIVRLIRNHLNNK